MKKNIWFACLFVAAVSISMVVLAPAKKDYSSWTTMAGSNDGIRYSSGDNITKKNVAQLEVAWVYDTHDETQRTTIPTTPLMLDGVLYGVSPQLNLFALDAATGVEKWVFKPLDPNASGSIRGISYWQSEDGKDKRIVYST